MRKAVQFLALLLLTLGVASCGGGGNGSLDGGSGENPGVPQHVRLSPSQNVAHTGASITLNALVTDGNGVPLAGVTVTFTKLTVLGTLSTTLPVTTNSLGIAAVNIQSPAPGFATVSAQISTATGFRRDMRSVFFSSSDSTNGLAFTPIAVQVDADGNNGIYNGIYNETNDLKVCQAANDNVVKIRATVFVAGVLASGITVNFAADSGILSSTTSTNALGEAFAEIIVDCVVQSVETVLNVYAYTDLIFVPTFNGFFSAIGAIPLFLQPVTVTSIVVTATPQTVAAEGDSQITATVSTSAGPISGVSVTFSTTCGTVDEAVSLTDASGIATTTYTAPAALGPCTIIARIGNVTGTVVVTVNAALAVAPSAATVASGGAVIFTITGGIPGYTVTISNLACTPLPASPVAASGGTFTVTTGAVGCTNTASPVTVTITDSAGTVITRTITITP